MAVSCSQSDLTAVTIPNVVPSLKLYGKASNNQRFFLSDNPETISSSVPFTNGYATLWADTASGLKSVTYRMFVWHLNNTGATIKFGVTIGNGSSGSTYQVSGVKDCIATITGFVAHGKCAAKALLGNTLIPSSPVDSSIAAGKVGLLKEWQVPNCVTSWDSSAWFLELFQYRRLWYFRWLCCSVYCRRRQ